MIELTHIATGALAGRRFTSPVHAAIAGVVMHGLMDVAPHGEINDRTFEVASTAVGIGALIVRYGPASPLVWGAIGGVLPDSEHLLPAWARPFGDVFPTHRISWLHSSDTRFAVPAWAQAVFGGAVIGALFMRRRPSPEQTARGLRRFVTIARALVALRALRRAL